MAYFSRCLIGRAAPILPTIIKSNSVLSQRIAAPAVLRTYTSSTSLTRNVSKFCLQNIHQQTKKVVLPMSVFSNQIRASSTDHVRLWQFERIVSAAFIVLLPGVLLVQSSIIDLLFSVLTVMHFHWGLEAVILDYVRPAIVGPVLPKVSMALLYALSALTLAGLGALIYNGPGVGGSVRKLWMNNKK